MTAYSRKQWIYAVCLSAIVGWVAVVAVPLAEAVLWYGKSPRQFFGADLRISFLFGIPISLIFCWVFLSPVLYFLMQRPIGPIRAAKLGILVSSAIFLLFFGYLRISGWMFSDPDFVAQSWPPPNPHIRKINGFLTPYGWSMAVFDFVVFVGVCTFGAILIQRTVGAGTQCTSNIGQTPSRDAYRTR